MRKADYATLAAIIKDEIKIAQEVIFSVSQFSDDESKNIARASVNTARTIADRFATLASVDKRAFLDACGIK